MGSSAQPPLWRCPVATRVIDSGLEHGGDALDETLDEVVGGRCDVTVLTLELGRNEHNLIGAEAKAGASPENAFQSTCDGNRVVVVSGAGPPDNVMEVAGPLVGPLDHQRGQGRHRRRDGVDGSVDGGSQPSPLGGPQERAVEEEFGPDVGHRTSWAAAKAMNRGQSLVQAVLPRSEPGVGMECVIGPVVNGDSVGDGLVGRGSHQAESAHGGKIGEGSAEPDQWVGAQLSGNGHVARSVHRWVIS